MAVIETRVIFWKANVVRSTNGNEGVVLRRTEEVKRLWSVDAGIDIEINPEAVMSNIYTAIPTTQW